MNTYLKNAWTVAGLASELPPGQLLARQLLNEHVVLWRSADGQPHALIDRCPHRFAPLSMGRITADGNAVQCPYHGLSFDTTGHCAHNPHGDGTRPKAAVVQRFPLVEQWGLLWIWMGDPARADAALIPDFSCLDPVHSHVAMGYLHVQANYLLEVDNILDLSHIEFLHPGSLGTEAIKQARTAVQQDGHSVWSLRQTVDEVLPDFLYHAFDVPHGQRVDRWIDVRWDAPSSLLLLGGTTPTGQPRSEGRQAPIAHFFTPETWTTTHYFFAVAFDKQRWADGAHRAPAVTAAVRAPFLNEDLPMLAAQQSHIGDADFWSLNPVLLPSDAPGVRARRLLQSLLTREQQTGQASP